ncbi:MAG: hypothetical protein LLG42_06045, partial [Chloroflexi bacterium]|nr:hypothetical protein [Chloroflexota bacterium]
VTINGSGDPGYVQIRAPLGANWTTKPASFSHTYPTIPGLLLYLDDPDGSSALKINGNSNNDIFRGSIYYPAGDITITGNADNVQWLVEVIGNTVVINGNAETNITYNGDFGHAGYPYISFQH